MVDPARLASLLRRIDEELAGIERLAAHDDAELEADADLVAAMKYRFVVAIEAAIDAGQHVIASEGLRTPVSFADVFAALADAGVLDEGRAVALGSMAGFRNLLVHRYGDVDDVRVIEIARSRLDDLRELRSTLAGLV